MDVATKLDIVEEVKRLKARYFYHLDRKDWAGWGEVFAEDVVMDVSAQFPDAPDPSVHVMRGRDTIVRSVSGFLGQTVTAHHGHTPIIDVHSKDEASGIWAMEDNLFMPDGSRMLGYGHYEEQYRRIDGIWRIAKTKLTRIRVIVTPPNA
ncbi:DUF4440 domain-containing protein [Nostoc sp. 3335mG]|nr:DUF4440 domain-containing protein [Nostoc sp. 3335mG]